MTDIEWWKEFGNCSCEACQESTEIQAIRASILRDHPDIEIPPSHTVNNPVSRPSLF